ncbi:MAG TPA: hypothetical protein VN805_07130 [Caulobacteraceae bacterium]|nr:hypothetical protein [Caulobacteraceae bacterium]
MRKLRVLIVAAIVALGIPPLAIPLASQPPAQATVPQSSAEQAPANEGNTYGGGYDPGTEQRPFVVETHATPESQAEASGDAAYQQQRAANEHSEEIGVASIIVGGFQTLALVLTFFIISYVAIRQLRAYVHPGIPGIVKFNLAEPIIVSLTFVNAGTTPAKHFRCGGVVFVGSLPLPDDFEMTEGTPQPAAARFSNTAVYPGEASTTVTLSSVEPLNAAQVGELKKSDPQIGIFVYARAIYQHAFDLPFTHRTTEYCRFIDPDSVRYFIGVQEGTVTAVANRPVGFTAAHILNRFS